MLKGIGFLVKLVLFSSLVLILGNSLHWRGRTLSEHTKTQMAQMEKSGLASHVRTWAGTVTTEAGDAIRTTASSAVNAATRATGSIAASSSASGGSETGISEKIPPSERQKLRALIRELNTPHGKD